MKKDDKGYAGRGCTWEAQRGRGGKRRTSRRRGGLVVLVAGAAIGLAACSEVSSPQVASLGKNSDGSAGTTTVPARSPPQLLDEWASCMRSHGDPGQVDPTVDAAEVIQITLGAGYAGGVRGGSGACGAYLTRHRPRWEVLRPRGHRTMRPRFISPSACGPTVSRPIPTRLATVKPSTQVAGGT